VGQRAGLGAAGHSLTGTPQSARTRRRPCDDTLVHFTGEGPYDESDLAISIGGYTHSDYDLRVYTTLHTFADPGSWYLVRVVYFTVQGDEGYGRRRTGSVLS
jgi:hypothetical protein